MKFSDTTIKMLQSARKLIVLTSKERFETPPFETLENILFGIIWVESLDSNHSNIVLSPYSGWTIEKNGFYQGFAIRDCRGEVRPIKWGGYSEVIEYPTWREYDLSNKEKEFIQLQKKYVENENKLEEKGEELSRLNETIWKLNETLVQIFDQNEIGGTGSRKKVHELIKSVIDITEVRELIKKSWK